MSQIFFVTLQRKIFVSDLTMAHDILGDRILSITIIPRRLGKEDEKLGKESEKLGKDKDELVKRLGIKAERLGKGKVEISSTPTKKGELAKDSTVRKIRTVCKEGNRMFALQMKY